MTKPRINGSYIFPLVPWDLRYLYSSAIVSHWPFENNGEVEKWAIRAYLLTGPWLSKPNKGKGPSKWFHQDNYCFFLSSVPTFYWLCAPCVLHFTGVAVTVGVSLYVLSISGFSEVNMVTQHSNLIRNECCSTSKQCWKHSIDESIYLNNFLILDKTPSVSSSISLLRWKTNA